MSLDRGRETLTERLRDQGLSVRVGTSPGSSLPRTRRHCGWLIGERYELNFDVVDPKVRIGREGVTVRRPVSTTLSLVEML